MRDFPYRVSVFWPRIPRSLGLAPLEQRLRELRVRLDAAGKPPYLGITWRAGTPPREQGTDTWSLYKEIPVPLIGKTLRPFPGTLMSVQRASAPGELRALADALGRPVHDFSDLNDDLEGMLALLALIDEYVGVSNTNMHLRAGAGKTARVLVPCPAEWRWMSDGPAAAWFPGFRVYRQSIEGDWRPALDALEHELAAAWPGNAAGT